MKAEGKQVVVTPPPRTYVIELSDSEALRIHDFLVGLYTAPYPEVNNFSKLLHKVLNGPAGAKFERS
jgi:hypothetical protein